MDKLRLINLDRSPERLARFKARNPHVPFERFAAIDGRAVVRDTCVADGLIAADNIYKPGAIGCALSHIALWRACAAGTDAFHIAEDDVSLRHDFTLLADILLETLGEWDIVLWSHNVDWPLQVRLSPGLGITVVQYDHRTADADRFATATTPPLMTALVTAAGTGCYSVSPGGARELLERCLPIGRTPASYLAARKSGWVNSGIDVEMSRHYDRLRSFVALPMLGLPDNDAATSTVQNHHDTPTA